MNISVRVTHRDFHLTWTNEFHIVISRTTCYQKEVITSQVVERNKVLLLKYCTWIQIQGTCAWLECFNFVWLFTSSPRFRSNYCTFYSTTFACQLYLLITFQILNVLYPSGMEHVFLKFCDLVVKTLRPLQQNKIFKNPPWLAAERFITKQERGSYYDFMVICAWFKHMMIS